MGNFTVHLAGNMSDILELHFGVLVFMRYYQVNVDWSFFLS